jgi:hypothetical protein
MAEAKRKRCSVELPRRSGKSTLIALVANTQPDHFVVLTTTEGLQAMKAKCDAKVTDDPNYEVPADKLLLADDVVHPQAYINLYTPRLPYAPPDNDGLARY